MFPVLFQAGDFVLASWHLFFVIGAFVGWYTLQSVREFVTPQLSAKAVDRLFVILYLAGYFGARIFSIFTEDDVASLGEFFTELTRFGAMTLYGGIMAVAAVLVAFAYLRDLSIRRLAAFFAAPGLVAIGLGRVGCFLNGDDFGKAIPDQYHPPAWAVRFPNLADGIYRYPVQLWEAAFGILFGLALVFWVRSRKDSALYLADFGVVGYTTVRFALEFFRGDERGQFFGTVLSTSQGISLVLLIAWIAYRIHHSAKNVQA